MGIPTRKEWVALKKKHNIPMGAVKNLEVGKAIDTYWNSGAETGKQQGVALGALETVLADYISQLDPKKVKNYAAFKQVFLDKYVGEAFKQKNDAARYRATKELYKKELIKFFSASQQLKLGKTTKNDFEKYKSGPLRGLSALGSATPGVDPREIDVLLGTINTGIQALKATDSRADLDEFITATLKTVEKVRKLAKAQELVK